MSRKMSPGGRIESHSRRGIFFASPEILEVRVLPAASSLLLSDLNGTNGATFLGIDTAISSPADFGDRSGWSVSGVGDVNGDGFDDMFVSAPFADGDPNSVSTRDSGECYLVFGKADWSMTSSMSFSSLNGTNGVIFYGIELQDNAGYSVSGAGDVNHDGFADLLIGAPLGDGAGNGTENVGETYLVFGKSDWSSTPSVNLSSLDGTSGVTFYGIDSTDFSGINVSGVGDVNGDNFDDFMIGADSTRGPNNQDSSGGESYLIFGKMDWSSTPTFNLSTLNGTNGVLFYGANVAGENFGNAGDMNGDGIQDLLLDSSQSGAAEVSLVFGKADWSSTPTVDLFTANSSVLIRIASPFPDAGMVVSKEGGDVNGDGYDDFMLGFPEADGPGGTILNSGESYLVFGRSDWSNPPSLSNVNGTDVVRFYGVDPGDSSGIVNIVGDLNGDGYDEITISAFVADGVTNNASQTGEVYVVYGKPNWQFTPNYYLAALDGINGYTIYGINDHDFAATQSGSGDVNGDGFDDLLIGAWGADSVNNSLSQAGEAYIVFGFDTSNPVIDKVGVHRGDTFY
ncbi:MAG: FG-GAP repeat protein, partial [Planctomycetaceae bacterium]|nr:FG-GAP repeat protein [Planctomycetaceae bacterium]